MVVVFDLDDTLYDEVDFVLSGFRAVAEYVDPERAAELLAFMWERFSADGSGRIFDALIERFELDVRVGDLVEHYRFHSPDIAMPADRRAVLEELAGAHPLGLVSDGPYTTQRNKFVALGLSRFIAAPVFTARLRAPKPDPAAFETLVRRFGAADRFVYVADNPRKDFVAPRALGWRSIRFRNPRGIYRHEEGEADAEISTLAALLAVL
jgi:putative hydrolase of the HAD superfamily